MSEELSPQALARKQRFLDEKGTHGGLDNLVKAQETRARRVYFDERGDIMSICHQEPHEVNPLWLTYNFDQHVINELDDKDVNKFWVVTRKDQTCEIQIRPQATVYATLTADDTVKVEFDPKLEVADCMVSIKEDHAEIQLSDKFKETMKGVYPIQATINGKRIFKFFMCDADQQGVIFDTITVSMVELLTEKIVTKELLADLRHCTVYTQPLFDKYLRV